MKKPQRSTRALLLSSLGLALAPSAFAATLVDFNAPGDFAAYFSSAQAGGIVASASGGLGNSGSLDLTNLALAPQVVTFNQGFSPTASSWSASIYFYGNAQSFSQFGVTTKAAPDLNEVTPEDAILPVIWMQTDGDYGGLLIIGNHTTGFFEYTQWDDIAVPGGLPASNAWYRYTISGNYLGDAQYEITARLHQANADGTLGAQLAELSSEYYNEGLMTSENFYFFINPGQGVTLDNFRFEVIPEPATLSAFLTGAAMLVWCRCRARQKQYARLDGPEVPPMG